MENNIKKVLASARYKPKHDLGAKIWHELIIKEKRNTYFKITSFSLLGLGSILGFISMFKTLMTDFTESGFYEYLSLAFSKGGIFSSYWKELIFSLAESLPTMNIAISLTLIFIFFLSLKYLSKQIINNKYMGLPYVGA